MNAPELHAAAIPVIVRVPALVAVIARCPACGQTNNALVAGEGAKFTPSKCPHAIAASLAPPEILFSETGE